MDADYVIDLHCDSEALLHFDTNDSAWSQLHLLATQIGAQAVMLAQCSGGEPFDEAVARPLLELAAHANNKAVPIACHSCTVELRGHTDVSDDFATTDARNLTKFLMCIACIDGDTDELPASQVRATPVAGVEYIRSPSAGVIAYVAQLKTNVKRDHHVGTVVDSYASAATTRAKIHAQRPGKIYARSRGRIAHPGSLLVTIAGEAAASTPSDITLLSD